MDNAMRVSDLIEDADEKILRIRGTIRMVTRMADPDFDSPDPTDVIGYLDTLDEALDQVHRDLGKAERALSRLWHGNGTVQHRKANGTRRRPGLALVKGIEASASH